MATAEVALAANEVADEAAAEAAWLLPGLLMATADSAWLVVNCVGWCRSCVRGDEGVQGFKCVQFKRCSFKVQFVQRCLIFRPEKDGCVKFVLKRTVGVIITRTKYRIILPSKGLLRLLNQ